MNNCFKVIWNEVTATFVAVPEIAKGKGAQTVGGAPSAVDFIPKTVTHFFIKPLVAALICIGFSFATYAAPSAPNLTAPTPTQLPNGAHVSAGTASVSQSGAVMTVKQESASAVVNWQTFNVGAQASVNFEQPTSQSVTLNRVLDTNPSQIFGKINANGSVFLQNPNGVYFAPGSSVDVGALVATTHSISDVDFMSGNYSFSRTGSTGKILNQGILTSKLGGYIALLAPEVQNQGVVVAKGGTIVLAAGETFQLQFEANNALTNILVSPSTIASYVDNGNAVLAPGGLVILSAQAANAIQGGVVKNTGSIQADGLVNDGGVIRLVASDRITNTGYITADALPGGTGSGGQILVIADLNNSSSVAAIDGTLSAKGGDLGGNGGFIETSGSHVQIAETANISTNAPKGTGGSWLIDPTDFSVGGTGSDMSGATLGANLNSTAVTIMSSSGATGTSGDININDSVAWTGGNKLTLSAANNININNAINVPTGGSVALVYGTSVATGDYNFGSFSANNTQFTGSINFAGTGAGLFTTKLGSNAIDSYTVISNPSTYVSNTNPTGGIVSSSGKYALGQNYNFDRSFTASPITGTFTGKFEGLGHTIGNLTNNGTGAIGLFSNSSGLIRDVGVNMSTSSAAVGTGGLANTNSGVIKNSFANVSIYSAVNSSGTALNGTLGGLVGNNSGLITNSFSTGAVSGTNLIGGLVGSNGTSSSTSPSNILNSFSKATVTGTTGANVGGLIGQNATSGSGLSSTVTNSFATGDVWVTTGVNGAGGLIGLNLAGVANSSAAVINSYATGNVNGPSTNGGMNYWAGGLIGQNTASASGANASVTGSYYTGNISVTASWLGGLIGLNQANGANSIVDISNSYTTGTVFNNPTGGVAVGTGGLVGLNRSGGSNASMKIQSSYATGAVTGTQYTGGLVGWTRANNSANHTISSSYATGPVSGTSDVGGLVGQNSSVTSAIANIDASYATGTVSSSNGGAGGLVGTNKADTASASSTSNISNSYASGNVTNTAGSYVGGLIGSNSSVNAANASYISNSYATGNVSSGGDSVGGLVGNNLGNGDSHIQQSYATGSVTSTSALGNNVGGLVGLNSGGATNSNVSISQSYATGAVSGAKTVGGLVGYISASSGTANIDQSYATSHVQQTNSTGVAGGLVGQVTAPSGTGLVRISNSFATGSVTGTGTNYLGGLVGNFAAATKGEIQNTYALGTLSGSTNMGGLIGSLTAGSSLQNNYWNSTNNAGLHTVNGSVASKSAATSGIASLSTAEMQTLSNFSGWDTTNVWQSLTYFNNQLPFLRQNNTLASIALVTGSNKYGDTPTLSYSITNSFGAAITNPIATGTPVWTLSQNGNVIGNQSISSTTNAGIYSLTYASGISLGNYTIMSGSPTNWTVTKAPLGISVTGTYSGTTSITPTSYTVTGLKNSETMVPTAVTLSNANVAASNKYVTAITANTGNANFNNYDVASSFNATPNSTTTNSATLNPIALSVSAVASLTGNPYKGSAYTGSYTSSAMVPADANLISVTGVAMGTDAGTYSSNLAVSLSGSAQTNYSTPAVTNANLVISPKTITITNTALTTDYDAVTTYAALAGQVNYANTALVGSDALGGVTQTANKTGIAQSGSFSVTPSAANVTSGNPNNYQFSYVSSNNTVSPLTLTVANTSVASKVYDGTATATVTNGTLQGVLAADALNVGLTQVGNFASVNVGATIGVTIADVLIGSAATNYTLTQPSGLTASITPKTLGITGQLGAHKAYDATTAATLTGGTLTGVVGNDAVSLVQTGSFVSVNVGTNIAISAANSLTGIGATNYQINQPTNLFANITPAILTVEGLAASSKVYDGTTTASLSGIAVARPLGGGQVTISGSPIGAFADKNVGSNKYIDVTGFSLSGADAGNYQVTGLHGVYGDITPASLSVSGLSAVDKVYDATTAATLTGGVFAGLINGDVVRANTGVFNSKNVGTNKSVTALVTGDDAGNYVVTGLTGYTANITPAPLTVSGQTAANKVYDATTSAVLSGGTLNGVLAGEAVTLNQAGSFTNKNVGTAKSIVADNSLTGNDASNYLVTQPTNVVANITPATLSVSGLVASNKTYDATTDAVITGAPVVTPLANDVVTLNGAATGVFNNKNAGLAKSVLLAGLTINNGSADGGNYIMPTDIGLTADIAKRDLTVTGTAVLSKVYDTSTAATLSGGALVGVQAGDTLSLAESGSFSDKDAGVGKTVTANDSISGTSASNYNLLQPTGLTGTINKASLFVVGLAANDKTYDATTSVTITGTADASPLAGDSVTISGMPSSQFSTKNAGQSIPVIFDAITLSGPDADNYTATGLTGITATISPAPLTATASTFTKVYDATTTATPSLTISGLIGNETLVVAATGTLNSKNVSEANALTVDSVALSDGSNGGLASNYVLSPGQTAAATVTPAVVTATGISASSSIYGSQITPGAVATSGLFSADSVTLGVVLENVSHSSSNHVNAGAYKQALTRLSGQDASNYTFVPFTTPEANYVVTPLVLTGSIASRSTNAGAVLTPGIATLNNVIAGDAVSITEVIVAIPGAVAGSKTGSAAGTFVGSQKIASITGADAANYDHSKVLGDYSINTGFSSGAVYPPEMTSSFARADKFIHKTNELPIENQTNNVKALSLALDKRVEVTEVNKYEQLSAMSSLVVPAAHAAQVFAPVVTNKNPAEIQNTNSLDISKQSTLTPNYASSFSDGVTSFEGMSNIYKGESSEDSNAMGAPNQDDVMAPIYKAVRDLLANPITYEVIGAASSIVLMVKTLVTPAMTTLPNTAPVHSPSRAPVRVPTQSSSFINNQSNMRIARRA
jgi:filamentous hemagglutinin family protein